MIISGSDWSSVAKVRLRGLWNSGSWSSVARSLDFAAVLVTPYTSVGPVRWPARYFELSGEIAGAIRDGSKPSVKMSTMEKC